MVTQSEPEGLSTGGSRLWQDITEAHPDLDPAQLVQLEEACRAKDRLDRLNQVLCGDTDTWVKLAEDVNSDGRVFEVRITQALPQANATANMMKQLLTALRLPDPGTGKRPQYRGSRVQKPTVPGSAKVSSLERARQAKSTG